MTRSGSRSPRRTDAQEDETELEDAEAALGPDGLPVDFKGGFSAQMRMQRDFLAGFTRQWQEPPNCKSSAASAPREAAAGLPVEAAQVLVLSQGPGPPTPWSGLPSHAACLAATLRLFAELLRNQVKETACDEFCNRFRQKSFETACTSQREELCQAAVDRKPPSPFSPSSQEALLELADTWGFEARPVPSAIETLDGMVLHRPATCCIFLDAYVGVLEDPDTGEEVEQEVGSHCILILGGDLLGPTYVIFDPWGPSCGEVSLWPHHAVQSASPAAWIELCPKAPTAAASTAEAGKQSDGYAS